MSVCTIHMLTVFKRLTNYNSSWYISLNYSTGPKLIYEGVRSYIFYVPSETKNVPRQDKLWNTQGSLGHTLLGLNWPAVEKNATPGTLRRFSVETENRCLTEMFRTKPDRKFTERKTKRGQAVEHWNTPHHTSQSILPVPHCCQSPRTNLVNISLCRNKRYGQVVRCIPILYSIYSRAWQRGQPQQCLCYHFMNNT